MARIIFTDSIGLAVLHNGKPAPANRFSSWRPSPMPIGDDAFRQSDGAKTKLRYRDDFGAAFELAGIPVASTLANLLEPNGDVVGTVGATPTGMSTTAPNTLEVALAHAFGAPGDYGYNALIAKHQRDNGDATGIVGFFTPSLTIARVYEFSLAVFIPSTSVVTDVHVDINNATGLTGGVADLTKRDQWQVLTCRGTAAATAATAARLRMTANTGAVVYSDLWRVSDVTAGTIVRPVDLADRLAYHLENGGTCQVDTGDIEGNIYTTCGVLPGATIQSPVLSDRKLLEYSLSLALVNLAGSPARMRCHYLA